MRIDRKRVREAFASYTRKYDVSDPKIALKIAHTYRVADNCEQIAVSIGLSKEDVEFAWLSGMLHDVGRFEQVKRYNTFIDSESVARIFSLERKCLSKTTPQTDHWMQ